MAAGFLNAHIDLKQVEGGLRRVLGRYGALGAAFHALEAPLRADQRDHGLKQQGPEGSWPARAASTQERLRFRVVGKNRTKRARRVLGKLPTTLRTQSGSNRVLAESKVRWAAAQQDGARVGRGAVLPARPFFWISPHMADLATRVLGHYLTKVW